MTAFLRLTTQWRLAPNGRRVGLDYAAVEAFLRLEGAKDPRDVFWRLQVLELAALEAAGARERRGS